MNAGYVEECVTDFIAKDFQATEILISTVKYAQEYGWIQPSQMPKKIIFTVKPCCMYDWLQQVLLGQPLGWNVLQIRCLTIYINITEVFDISCAQL